MLRQNSGAIFFFCKVSGRTSVSHGRWRMTICPFRSCELFNAFLNFLYRQDNQFYTVFIDLCLLCCGNLHVYYYYYYYILLFYWYILFMAAILLLLVLFYLSRNNASCCLLLITVTSSGRHEEMAGCKKCNRTKLSQQKSTLARPILLCQWFALIKRDEISDY